MSRYLSVFVLMSLCLCMCSGLFVKPNGDLYHEGDVMYRRQLADTLDIIASDDGVYDMYNGSLAQLIVQDLHDIG